MTNAVYARGGVPTGAIQWKALVPAVPIDLLGDEQRAALAPSQLKAEFYRVLVHRPELLTHRTAIDDLIFHTKNRLDRSDREFAALASSMVTGCKVCTSIHARFTKRLSGRGDDIDRLLANGFDEDLGGRWNQLLSASSQLAHTPSELTENDIDAMRGNGFDEEEILEVGLAAAFFAWANRSMMSLGVSTVTE